MSQKREILRMERIKTDHRGIRILTDAKLNLFDGETVGVLGVNYSGKTALAGAICGFFPCTDGKITYMEQFSFDYISDSGQRDGNFLYPAGIHAGG